MELEAHSPQKIVSLIEPQLFGFRNPAFGRQRFERRIGQVDYSGPPDNVKVPHAPAPLFHVRFEQVGALSILLQPAFPVLDEVLQKAAAAVASETFDKRFSPVVEKVLVSGNEARLEVVGKNGEVVGGQPFCDRDGSRLVADFKAAVPQAVNQLAHEFL